MSRIPKCVASVKRLFLFTELSEIAPIYRTEKKLNGSDVQLWFVQVRVVHGLGQPTGWVGLSLVGLGWVDIFFDFWWVGLGRGPKRQKHKNEKSFMR